MRFLAASPRSEVPSTFATATLPNHLHKAECLIHRTSESHTKPSHHRASSQAWTTPGKDPGSVDSAASSCSYNITTTMKYIINGTKSHNTDKIRSKGPAAAASSKVSPFSSVTPGLHTPGALRTAHCIQLEILSYIFSAIPQETQEKHAKSATQTRVRKMDMASRLKGCQLRHRCRHRRPLPLTVCDSNTAESIC